MPNMVGMVPASQNSADYAALEADEDVRDRSVARDDAKVDDRKLLSAEDFDPNACEWEYNISLALHTNQCSPKAQVGKLD